MVKDDASSDNDDEIPMVPSLLFMKNDASFSKDTDDELPVDKNMRSLHLDIPSLKARPDHSGLVVDTALEPETTGRQNINGPDGYDDCSVPFDRSFSPPRSPPTSKKTVRIDHSKTPQAALSVVDKGEDSSAMDFEILPDESDEEDEDFEGDVHRDDDDEEEEEDEEEGVASDSNDDHALVRKKRNNKENPSDSASTNNNKDIQSPDSSAHSQLPYSSAHSSSQKPSSRKRFPFAPKSPKSTPKSPKSLYNMSLLAPKSPSLASLNPATASDSTGNNASVQLDREKPRGGQRLSTMIRKMKAVRKESKKSDSFETSKSSDALAGADINMVDSALDEQDSSSDESSFDDEENWSEEESQLFDDEVDQPVDCSSLHSSLPKSFLDLPPDVYDYLDSNLVTEIENQDVSTYAWEHHLFVKGLLQLLAERDLIGVEDDIFNAHNVLKMGVLRKKDDKIGWRVKYVEVRKGNLTYFDNKGNEKGRTIHLRKRRCMCRKISNKEGGQDISFELVVDGGRRLLWTAKSEEECHGWVRAINQAMIGEVNDSRDITLDLSLYRNAIDDYQTIHSSLKEVGTRQEYLVAMTTLLYRQTSSSALRVPMKWIRDNYLEEESKEETMKDSERIKYAVREFWKNLCNTSVILNEYSVTADGIYSGERVIGALSRCILEFDKVENTGDFDQIFNSLKKSLREGNSSITELQAVLYARNILSGALQSSSRGDIKAAVEELFRNDDVAYAELESSEPLHIYVSYAGDDFSESKPRQTEFVGWIETKSKKSKKWKMRYFVLSEGVLSYFERANPRPHRLNGQIVLRDAKFKILEGNIISLIVQNRERLLRFSDRGELIKWKSIMDEKGSNVDALIGPDLGKNEEAQKGLEKIEAQKDAERIVAQKDSSDEEQMPEETTKEVHLAPSRERLTNAFSEENISNGKSQGRVRGAGAKFLKKAALAKKRAKDRTGARMKSIRTGAGSFIRGVRGNSNSEESIGRRPINDMITSSTRNLNDSIEERKPTVQAVVEMNSTFRVVSKNTSDVGRQEEETLL